MLFIMLDAALTVSMPLVMALTVSMPLLVALVPRAAWPASQGAKAALLMPPAGTKLARRAFDGRSRHRAGYDVFPGAAPAERAERPEGAEGTKRPEGTGDPPCRAAKAPRAPARPKAARGRAGKESRPRAGPREPRAGGGSVTLGKPLGEHSSAPLSICRNMSRYIVTYHHYDRHEDSICQVLSHSAIDRRRLGMQQWAPIRMSIAATSDEERGA